MTGRLMILWDPENPLVPAGPVIAALGESVEVVEVTFREVSHRTLPNRAFEIGPLVASSKADSVLWVEGGPYPNDLEKLECRKACWIVNGHHEPSLLDGITSPFNVRFSSVLRQTADESWRWLPFAARAGKAPVPPSGLSVVFDDPNPPRHIAAERALRRAGSDLGPVEAPVVFCLGQGERVHSLFFECLRSGAAVVTETECDLRGLVHVGEHVEVYPGLETLVDFARELIKDGERLSRLRSRGPEIISHLHAPELRAGQLRGGIWPSHKVLGPGGGSPRVSILVTCHRYLRRLKLCLASLARQDMAPGAIEIVVADPASPDGLADYLREFAASAPQLRVVHLPLDPRYHRNRGVGINRAFDASLGKVVISIDGDIVFPPHLVRLLAESVRKAPSSVFGMRRSFLDRETTERILRGEVDPFAEFDRLKESEGDGEEKPFVGVLGYCQAVDRRAFAKARYPEEFDMVNQSDIVFVERLAKEANVRPRFLEKEAVLHLWHPRNWSGTTEFL